MSSDIENKVCDQLIRNLSDSSDTLKINPSNILPIAVNSVRLVEKYSNATGDLKKSIVYNVLTKLMENCEVNDKENVLLFLTNTLDNFINMSVSMMNGEMKFDYKMSRLGKKLKDFFLCKK